MKCEVWRTRPHSKMQERSDGHQQEEGMHCPRPQAGHHLLVATHAVHEPREEPAAPPHVSHPVLQPVQVERAARPPHASPCWHYLGQGQSTEVSTHSCSPSQTLPGFGARGAKRRRPDNKEIDSLPTPPQIHIVYLSTNLMGSFLILNFLFIFPILILISYSDLQLELVA